MSVTSRNNIHGDRKRVQQKRNVISSKSFFHIVCCVLPFLERRRRRRRLRRLKVFSRDVRAHKKRRQKDDSFEGEKEKNAEKKRTHRDDFAKIETARARRDATRPRRLRRQKKNERRFPRAKIITTPRTTSSFVIRFDAIFLESFSISVIISAFDCTLIDVVVVSSKNAEKTDM